MTDSATYADLMILGSGPAGLTAAIYAARGQVTPLLLRGLQPGGQLATTTLVENFPGFPEGVDGPELMQRMEDQARHFGTRIEDGMVTRVDLSGSPLRIWTEEKEYTCRSLIVATGSSPKMLGLPEEKAFFGKGLSVCATCDGFFYRGKHVVVVGGGDTAVEEAIFMTRFASQVTLVHRRDQLRAAASLQQRAQKNKLIQFVWNSEISGILGDQNIGVQGVRLRNGVTGEENELACDGIFIAIGHKPNTALFAGQLELDANGYLCTDNCGRCSHPAVFSAGDVQDFRYRQAITAAGSGCRAAMDALKFLEEEG